MMRKIGAVLLVLFLLFGTSLQAFALTDSQRWKMEYQIQKLPEEYLELYAILPEGAYHSEHVVSVQNVMYGDWGMGPEGVLIQELIDNGVLVPPKESAKAWGWENNPDVIYIPASEVRKIYEQTFGS
ncbi:MAG: hypothetical protein IIV79_04400, partial [Clostridia bacterium]|nr:hypothetical protein [Clostridia bacterium]